MSTGGKLTEMEEVLLKLAKRVGDDKIKAGMFEQALTAIYEIGLTVIRAAHDYAVRECELESLTATGADHMLEHAEKAWAKACGVAEK